VGWHAEATDLSPVVINEIQIVGSRCGPFEGGLGGMLRHRFPVQRLVAAHYPFDRAIEAFEHAGRPGALKVILDIP
jgi:threonine dehydrogenase-like Zn-dependent dehydrogenase